MSILFGSSFKMQQGSNWIKGNLFNKLKLTNPFNLYAEVAQLVEQLICNQ